MKKFLPLLLLLGACNTSAPLASIDAANRDRLERHYPKTLEKLDNQRPLRMIDVINLTRAGFSDREIIHEIHATRSSFYLTPDDEQTLEQAGVSKRVIDEMKDSAYTRY